MGSIPARLRKSDRILFWLSRNWILAVSAALGMIVLLPFLAPVFMRAGLTLPAKIIYWVYSYFCHQLPERSYFLFGPKISYSLAEIQSVWQNTIDAAVLRKFIGTLQMGWKVAWSDRMVSMYSSLWLFGILWIPFRKKIKALPWWGLILFLLPMAADGFSHMISDISGLGQGFRDSNAWLSVLTQSRLPDSFYSGDAWGSFNAWMRLITGILFGVGIVWTAYPVIDKAFEDSSNALRLRIERNALLNRGRLYLAGLKSAKAKGLSSEPSLEQNNLKD
jgi:uncharacterized membrane protein